MRLLPRCAGPWRMWPRSRRSELARIARQSATSRSCAMPGRKLTLKAMTCAASTRRHTTAALAALVPLRTRSPATSPRIDDNPTTSVIATSMGENVPEMTCAQPRRKSQIRLIISSQQQKQGSAVHLVQRESRKPKMTVGHTGAVWTTWRSTPWDTTPTTYSAAMRKTAHSARAREAFD